MTQHEVRHFCEDRANVTALLLSDDPEDDKLSTLGKEPRLDPL